MDITAWGVVHLSEEAGFGMVGGFWNARVGGFGTWCLLNKMLAVPQPEGVGGVVVTKR